MSSSSKILKLLSDKKGEFVSGEEIAGELGVTRAAVSKACATLRKSGYEIESRTNKGYRLSKDSDVLSQDLIDPYIHTHCNVCVYDEVSSTNDIAKEAHLDDLPLIVIADKQTAGRGRLGRAFESPAGTGLYMSIAFRPDYDIEKSLFVTMAAAVGTCRAIERIIRPTNANGNAKMCEHEQAAPSSQDTALKLQKSLADAAGPKIKWVNDLFIGRKKVCGILTEAQSDFESGHIDRLVVGIGVNCFPGSFPPEIRDIAGPVSKVKGAFSRNKLAAAMIDEILPLITVPERDSFLPEYRDRCFILGHEITVHRTYNDAGIPAKALEVTDDGGLMVEYLDGASGRIKGTSRAPSSKDQPPGGSNPVRTEKKTPGTKDILRTGEISISL